MSLDTTYDRRAFMSYFGALGLSSTLLPGVLWAQANQQQGTPITKEMVAAAEQLAGLEFTEEERTAIANGLAGTRGTIQRLHQNPLPYNTVASPKATKPAASVTTAYSPDAFSVMRPSIDAG